MLINSRSLCKSRKRPLRRVGRIACRGLTPMARSMCDFAHAEAASERNAWAKSREISANTDDTGRRFCPPYRESPAHDRLRRVAHALDIVAGVEEGDDAAGAALEPLVAPGERADQRPLVEHELDVAAEVLGVQQALLERPIVEWEHVGQDLAAGFLVRVLEGAEELRRRLALQPGELG